eukprot:1180825-Prymnesium_polylepis.1
MSSRAARRAKAHVPAAGGELATGAVLRPNAAQDHTPGHDGRGHSDWAAAEEALGPQVGDKRDRPDAAADDNKCSGATDHGHHVEDEPPEGAPAMLPDAQLIPAA